METTEIMTWGKFKSLLKGQSDKQLQFRYAKDSILDPSYHITEIKEASITSVDCGGKINRWDEIIVQLWEPHSMGEGEFMKVNKALSIINTVEKLIPLNSSAIVKIEFGNKGFDTRQMYPVEFVIDPGQLIINLNPDKTQCKAIDRGQSCGVSQEDECCNPVAVTQVDEKKSVGVSACCGSTSVCC